MKLDVQKKLAAKIVGKSPKKVKLDPERKEEIKEAITRADIKQLIGDGAIKIEQDKGISKGRARKHKSQKKKGRRKGQGRRKGSANARHSSKEKWMARIRLQRKFLKTLKEKDKVTNEIYKDLYGKVKGGFFRSKRHIKIYIEEHELMK